MSRRRSESPDLTLSSPSHVHRLVQDENAKTILLNVPLEISLPGSPGSIDPNLSLKAPRRGNSGSNAVSPKESSSVRQQKNIREGSTLKKGHSEAKTQRVRSASVGRNKESDMQARYWAFLFENLRRAVDDLYVTCESDDSVPAAKEVVLVLENYVRDFKNLVDWLRLKWEYENTPPLQRPASLAWEVRKTSPAGKLTPTTALAAQRLLLATPVKRVLNFEDKSKEPLQTHKEALKEVDVTPVDEKENEAPVTPEAPQHSKTVTDGKEKIQSTSAKDEKSETGESIKASNSNHEVTKSKRAVNVPKSNSAPSRASSSSKTTNSTAPKGIGPRVRSMVGPSKDGSAGSRPVSGSRVTAASRSLSSHNLSAGHSHQKITGGKDSSPKVARKFDQKKDSGKIESTATKPAKRVSLVARQSMVAANQNRSSNKAPSTSNVNRAKGASTFSTSNRPLKPPATTKSGLNITTTRVKTGSSMNSHGSLRRSSGTLPPFGSTSSISSSGSGRSWADTVRGLSSPRSVENVSKNAEHKPNDFEQIGEEDGWETVRPRSRSKVSPGHKERLMQRGVLRTSQSVNKQALVKRDSLDSSFKVKNSAKTRYHLPSSAKSLPTLAFMKEEEQEHDDNQSKEAKQRKPDRRSLSPLKFEEADEGNLGTNSTENLNKEAPETEDNTAVVIEEISKERDQNIESAPSEDGNESATDCAIAQNEVAIAKAQEEEEKLAREIKETQDEELSEPDATATPTAEPEVTHAATACQTIQTQNFFEGMSWADEVELEEKMYESRYPGRAIELHEKLSSPARKKDPREALKMHEEKQQQARLRREKFQDQKAMRLGVLNRRFQEVITQKEILISLRRDLLETKMRKAEEKRQRHIEGIRRKAHEEDAKLKEIAFINVLQAQNSRIDMLAHSQTADEKHEERLAELAEERARKVEERASKEARAEENRKRLEEQRQKEMQALKERIRTREERIQEEQEAARKEREEAAREKARDREEKLSNVRAAQKDLKTELKEKIQQKQEDAAKRHREKLQKIRTKAFELSVQRCSTEDEGVPNLHWYEPKKKCSICNVIIYNEVHLQSHLRGKTHCQNVKEDNNGRNLSGEEIQSCNLKYIIDAGDNDQDAKAMEAKERSKAMKKKVKKIRNRMLQKAAEYEEKLVLPTKFDSPNRGKIGKSLKEIEKIFSSQGKGAWPKNSLSQLERSLGEINRALDKKQSADRITFFALNGFVILAKIFHLLAEQKSSCVIPLKTVVTCSKTWSMACQGDKNNTEYVVKYNHLGWIVDILLDRLQLLAPTNKCRSDTDSDCPPMGPQLDPVAKALMNLLTHCLEDLASTFEKSGVSIDQSKPEDVPVRVQDLIGYTVNSGIIDLLADYLNGVQDPIDNQQDIGDFLLTSLNFMSSLAKVSELLVKPPGDPTNLLLAYRVTDLAGIVSMLYGILLHQGAPARGNQEPPKIPDHTVSVAIASLKLLHHLVRQHLTLVQDVLGQEGISLEFRHIASYLIWYCQHHGESELLHLIIILIGYFAARHSENQAIVQAGHRPSILQQLCTLPFQFFCQPELKNILFPTLISVCHENQGNLDILAEDVSPKLLEDFKSTKEGKSNHLMQLVLVQTVSSET